MEETVQDIHQQLAMARLPSLPQALLQLMDLVERDDAGMAEFGAVISQDSALAAKVLAAANSAYYNPGRNLASLNQCMSILGVAQIRRIALNQSVAELFSRFQKAGGFDMRYYWHHVLSVALTARSLARHMEYTHEDEAYLAGLLHDIGQLALLAVAPDRYMPIFKRATGEISLLEQEQEVFGLNHAEVGAWLGQRWNLHSFFTDALLYHHESLVRIKDAHVLVQIVTLANLLCTLDEGEIGIADEDLAYWKLGLDQALEMVKTAEAEVEDVAASLGVDVARRPKQPKFSPVTDNAADASLANAVAIRLEAQHSVPEEIADGTDMEALYLSILRSARMLFATRHATLFVIQDGVLHGKHTQDDDARLGEIRIRLPGQDSAIARALKGAPTLAGEDPARESLADAQVLRILGCERLLCMPLAHEGKPQGVLVIGLTAGAALIFMHRKPLITTFARETGRRLALSAEYTRTNQAIRDELNAEFQLHARKVVHEVNNPLGVVRNYIALLREQVADKKQVQEDFDQVESELRRVARILQDLKKTSSATKISVGGVSSVDLNSLINDVIRFCRMGRPEMQRVETRLNLDSSLPSIKVDSDKVKQVLTNLIFNAAEAMPEGGEVAISSANWQSAMGGHSVEITVSDTGPGLPPAVLEQLYQPVKSQKGGTHQGLGLSIVGKLVEELGGVMHCKSSHSGTSFKILLPAGN